MAGRSAEGADGVDAVVAAALGQARGDVLFALGLPGADLDDRLVLVVEVDKEEEVAVVAVARR